MNMRTKIILTLFILMLFKPSYAQLETEWHASIGDASTDLCNDIAIDYKGNTFAIGYVSKDVGDAKNAQRLSFTYLNKYDVKGKLLWSKEMIGDVGNQGKAIAIDKEGNVYICGVFVKNIRLDGLNMINDSEDANTFIAKYDNNGNFIWHKILRPMQDVKATQHKDDEEDHDHDNGHNHNHAAHQPHFHSIINQITDMELDHENNLYLTGFFDKAIDFDPSDKIAKVSAQGLMDAFILKLDYEGNFKWVKTIEGKGANKGNAIDFDSKNNVYVTGSFTETASIGKLNIHANGGSGIYIAKLDKNGHEQWVKKIDNTKLNSGNDIHIDTADFIYLTGNIGSRTEITEINKTIEAKENSANVFIAKLDPEGDYLWVEAINGEPYASGQSIVTDAFGNIYITGYFNGNMLYKDKTILNGNGKEDGFIIMLNKDGDILFTQAIGGLTHDRAAHLIIHSDNSLVVSGACNGPFFIDPVSFTGLVEFQGTTDAFIIKFGHLLEKPELSILELINNSIKLTWKEQPYATGYEIILQQGKNATPYYVGNNTITFTPIASGTAYTIKARAYTDSKQSKQSELKVITPPQALDAKGVKSNEFTANWTKSKTETFLLYVSTTNDFSECLPDYNALKVSKPSLKISGLQPNTTYYYRLQTALGNFSNIVKVKTKE